MPVNPCTEMSYKLTTAERHRKLREKIVYQIHLARQRNCNMALNGYISNRNAIKTVHHYVCAGSFHFDALTAAPNNTFPNFQYANCPG